MNIFSIFLGSSRIEFSVVFERNKYVGKINGRIHVENVDFDLVREEMTLSMNQTPNLNKLH